MECVIALALLKVEAERISGPRGFVQHGSSWRVKTRGASACCRRDLTLRVRAPAAAHRYVGLVESGQRVLPSGLVRQPGRKSRGRPEDILAARQQREPASPPASAATFGSRRTELSIPDILARAPAPASRGVAAVPLWTVPDRPASAVAGRTPYNRSAAERRGSMAITGPVEYFAAQTRAACAAATRGRSYSSEAATAPPLWKPQTPRFAHPASFSSHGLWPAPARPRRRSSVRPVLPGWGVEHDDGGAIGRDRRR